MVGAQTSVSDAEEGAEAVMEERGVTAGRRARGRRWGVERPVSGGSGVGSNSSLWTPLSRRLDRPLDRVGRFPGRSLMGLHWLPPAPSELVKVCGCLRAGKSEWETVFQCTPIVMCIGHVMCHHFAPSPPSPPPLSLSLSCPSPLSLTRHEVIVCSWRVRQNPKTHSSHTLSLSVPPPPTPPPPPPQTPQLVIRPDTLCDLEWGGGGGL